MSLVIVQPGEKLPSLAGVAGDFADWVLAGMRTPGEIATTVYPHRGDAYPGVQDIDAVVITGSSAMVTDNAPWMVAGAGWLRQVVAAGIPVLGICFGHQWLGAALGGRVAPNPRGTEVGSVPVNLSGEAADDPLLGGMPARMLLPLSHRQSLTELPPAAIHLAYSDLEPNQAFRVGERAWGVQFHPEFSAEITRGYLDYHAATVTAAGRDPERLKAAVAENTLGGSILNRFATISGLRQG